MMSSSSYLLYMLAYITYSNLIVSSQSTTLDPTQEPTVEPTIDPTTAPSAAPTVIPTIEESFCNLFNGKSMKNTIHVTQNRIISNIKIEDPLIISFDFIISENECTTNENKICNLIRFGKFFESNSVEDISFPMISTINKNGTLHWIIEINDGNTNTHINNTVNKSDEYFAIRPNIPSNFHITFSGFQRAIYINSELFHHQEDNETDFSELTNETHPFYVSSPDQTALNANITNLCISTASFSPSTYPTQEPSIAPTVSPTFEPTEQAISTTLYNKIDCYTEYGQPGDVSIYCLKPNYIIISCGLIRLNGIDTSDIIFYKGTYSERRIINDLTTDGICYINYNIKTRNISQYIKPQARCCNFEQQYNTDFKCRYFKSQDDTIEKSNQDATEQAATQPNEFTFTTCPNSFPHLLSCSTILTEDSRVTAYAESNNDIQFYGSFYADSSGEYNENNLYFQLNTGVNSTKTIPFAPTLSTTSTSRVVLTPSPTFRPTSSRTELRLNISQTTHCVAQYGPKDGNYSISSIATCCTESFDSLSETNIFQSTLAPTTAPTVAPELVSKLIGTNGTNTGIQYKENAFENGIAESVIIGINTWNIWQVTDQNIIEEDEKSVTYLIWYQGVLITSYDTIDSNGKIETKTNSLGRVSKNFEPETSCAGFTLDIDEDGNRDYINGYDIYYHDMAIYGLTFYTSFGRSYSCPDHLVFEDTSEAKASPLTIGTVGNNDDLSKTIPSKHYKITVVKERNVFAVNGTYKLSGWRGWLQTRYVTVGVQRSVYGSIQFSFIGNATINTNSPTPAPSKSPTNSKKTLSPTFAGQKASESLRCYTLWGVNEIKCKEGVFETMLGCNGYSVEGQIFNAYINDTNDMCIVETLNNKPAAAIATCCYFYEIPPRNFTVLITTAIVCGSLFFGLFLFMTGCLFFNIKNVKYYEEDDVDDDTKIDEALENVGQDVASTKIAQFKVTESDHAEMVELARRNSGSTGLQV